jgi:hypothetical protein
MIDILIAIVCGMITCVFGMWCFIKGQHNALQLYRNELPQQLSNPVRAVVEGVQAMQEDAESKKSSDKMQENLERFAAYNAELPSDKEV